MIELMVKNKTTMIINLATMDAITREWWEGARKATLGRRSEEASGGGGASSGGDGGGGLSLMMVLLDLPSTA
jgi:uncharacterized membrane protein